MSKNKKVEKKENARIQIALFRRRGIRQEEAYLK